MGDNESGSTDKNSPFSSKILTSNPNISMLIGRRRQEIDNLTPDQQKVLRRQLESVAGGGSSNAVSANELTDEHMQLMIMHIKQGNYEEAEKVTTKDSEGKDYCNKREYLINTIKNNPNLKHLNEKELGKIINQSKKLTMDNLQSLCQILNHPKVFGANSKLKNETILGITGVMNDGNIENGKKSAQIMGLIN